MALPRRRAPFWFELCVVVVLGCLLRRVIGGEPLSSGPAGDGAHYQYAFWFFIVAIANAIWKGLEIAGKVTLEVLKWTVLHLSALIAKTINGLKAVGHGLMVSLKGVWSFTRKLYDDVLKPAWQKFWKWFDKVRRWLDDTFGPILKWLRRLRDNLLLFYKTFIRPWLDLIDVTRKLLRVFSALGLEWAKALDKKLGELETAIEKPFRVVLAKLNEVINVVNRIATLDGLLQRVALVRSIARDYQYVWNTLRNAYTKPLTGDDKTKLRDKNKPRTVPEIDSEAVRFLATGDGPRAAVFEEMYLTVRNNVRARP